MVIRRSWTEHVLRLPAPIARASCPLKRGLSRHQLPTLASSGCNGAAQLRGSRLGCCGTYVDDRCGGHAGINRGADRVYETCSTVKLHVSAEDLKVSCGWLVPSETESYCNVLCSTALSEEDSVGHWEQYPPTRSPQPLPSPERATIEVSDPVGAGRRLWPAVRRIIGMVAYDVRTVMC